MARGAGASGWGGGSGAGGAKGRREEYSLSTKPFSASELNITGTEKQISYARDIVQGAFDTMDSNIKRNQDLAKTAKSDGTRKFYESEASTWKEFKSDMTTQYRQNAKTTLKASGIIESRYNFDAVKNFNQWKRMKKKK